MPTKTTSNPPSPETLSLSMLVIVLALANAWFVSQALTYWA